MYREINGKADGISKAGLQLENGLSKAGLKTFLINLSLEL